MGLDGLPTPQALLFLGVLQAAWVRLHLGSSHFPDFLGSSLELSHCQTMIQASLAAPGATAPASPLSIPPGMP